MESVGITGTSDKEDARALLIEQNVPLFREFLARPSLDNALHLCNTSGCSGPLSLILVILFFLDESQVEAGLNGEGSPSSLVMKSSVEMASMVTLILVMV